VVARWIDPATRQPSGTVVASSISGFVFSGNEGNPVTGYTDSTGQNFGRFGSDDTTLEGFFDLAGLQIPNGASSGQYQLSVEAVDSLWSTNAGPYGSAGQVQPSGSAPAVLITVNPGGDVAHDILMAGVMTLTAKLTPATYPNPQQVQVTLLGVSSPLDLSLMAPSVWIAQGATVNVPITARVLSNGSPVIGKTVNYQITRGTGES
jgi:hypothetical protein